VKRILLGVVIGVILSMAIDLGAQSRRIGPYVWGAQGRESCAAWTAGQTWIQARRSDPKAIKPTMDAFMRSAWVLGFMTGAAWDSSDGVLTHLPPVEASGVYAAISEACTANPQRSLVDVSREVYDRIAGSVR
jgi:hypothetical protein